MQSDWRPQEGGTLCEGTGRRLCKDEADPGGRFCGPGNTKAHGCHHRRKRQEGLPQTFRDCGPAATLILNSF